MTAHRKSVSKPPGALAGGIGLRSPPRQPLWGPLSRHRPVDGLLVLAVAMAGMTFVTKLTFQSGDRAVLRETVDSVTETVERKGAQCKGPHTEPERHLSVPQHRTLQPGSSFSSWDYSVYEHRIDIHGSEHIAREVGHMEFPDSVHVEIEVEQQQPLGGN